MHQDLHTMLPVQAEPPASWRPAAEPTPAASEAAPTPTPAPAAAAAAAAAAAPQATAGLGHPPGFVARRLVVFAGILLG
jgi:hypothetical protein